VTTSDEPQDQPPEQEPPEEQFGTWTVISTDNGNKPEADK